MIISSVINLDEFGVFGRKETLTRVRFTDEIVCQGWDIQKTLNSCVEVASISVIFKSLH